MRKTNEINEIINVAEQLKAKNIENNNKQKLYFSLLNTLIRSFKKTGDIEQTINIFKYILLGANLKGSTFENRDQFFKWLYDNGKIQILKDVALNQPSLKDTIDQAVFIILTRVFLLNQSLLKEPRITIGFRLLLSP